MNQRDTVAIERRGRLGGSDLVPILNDLLIVWDIFAGCACGYASLAFYLWEVRSRPGVVLMDRPFLPEVILASVVAALLLRDARFGAIENLLRPGRLLYHTLHRSVGLVALLLSIGLLTGSLATMSRLWLLCWIATFIPTLFLSRIVFLFCMKVIHRRGWLRENVAVIGCKSSTAAVVDRVRYDTEIVAVFDDLAFDADPFSREETLADIIDLGRSGELDSVIVAMSPGEELDIATLVSDLRSLPIPVTLCSSVGAMQPASPTPRLVNGLSMTIIRDKPIRRWNLLAKTLLDLLLSAVLSVLLLPLLIAIAVAIAAESDGPILFRQRRNGWGGQPFILLKFRSMHDAAAAGDVRWQTVRNDPRCTRIGAWLRRTSLDELPQLLNVLRGEMSLVGPRPHADEMHVADNAPDGSLREYAQRHRVKPGITGWAQINGFRGATQSSEEMRDRVKHDLFYIENWSLFLDLRILAATPLCIIRGRNAF